jgi:hypothetical protein
MPISKQSKFTGWGMDDLFGEPDMPEGFQYMGEALSVADEQDFMRGFETLSLQPFEFQGFLANRRIFTFGRSYVFAGQKPRPDSSIPGHFRPLMEIASQISGESAEAFEQVMISEYTPGAGIGWHRDRPTYGTIVAISFGASCVLRLRRRASDTWERRSVLIEPRSVYLLDGPARALWQHSIAPMDVLRYSVTLRTFRKSIAPRH